MAEAERDTTPIELAAGIVESSVSNNQRQPDQRPDFLANIHSKLALVAQDCSVQRSQMAKKLGLGRKAKGKD